MHIALMILNKHVTPALDRNSGSTCSENKGRLFLLIIQDMYENILNNGEKTARAKV
jgi:hypothetical protein